MRRTRYLTLALATLAGIFTLAVVPVAAEDGASGSSGSGESTTSSGATTTSRDAETEPPQTATDDSTTEVKTAESHGGTLLAELRLHGTTHSKELRQKVCQQRQDTVDNRIGNFSAAGERHLGVFDKIFTKVQAFVTNKKLTVTNYDSLVANVTAKQTAAKAAADALKVLDVKVDCTQPDPAQTLATVKSAVSDARTALQAYRTALKDLIVAIKGASSANDNSTKNSTTGGN